MQASDARAERVELIWLFTIILVGVAFRIIAIVEFQHVPATDELAYQSMAINLVNGKGIVDFMGNRAMYNVGYPLFVLAPLFAVFGDSVIAPRVVNTVLGALAIFLCYAVAKEAGAGRNGRLLSAALWALYLPASVYGVYLAKENLMIPLMLAIMWCAFRLTKDSVPLKTAIACGLLFGALALTGNAALSLALPVLVGLLISSSSAGKTLSTLLMIAISAVIVVAPWMIRNHHVLGAAVINTNGGFNLYLGNNPAATGMFVSISDTPRGPTWEDLRKNGEVQASETLRDEAIAWIRENPSAFLILAIRKGAYFWIPPFHEGKGQSVRGESVVRVMWLIQFIALITLAAGSSLFSRLRTRYLAMLFLAIMSYTGVHMLFYVIFRYREPIMPFLCVLAGLALEQLSLRLPSRRT